MLMEIAKILLESKRIDKWVPVHLLIKYGINNERINHLEDKGILLVKNTDLHGKVLKLTLKGYHEFSQALIQKNSLFG